MRTKNLSLMLTGFFMLAMCVDGSAEMLKPQSRIIEVTVYPDSALVKRMTTVNLSKGEHQIIFSDIIPDVDENSLTVSGRGEAQVNIFGVQLKREYLLESPSEAIQKIQSEIESISDQIETKNNYLEVLKEEKDFLNSIKLSSEQQIPKDLMTKLPSVTDLDSLAKFLVSKFEDNEKHRQDTTLAMRELNRKKDALNRQLQDLNAGNRKMQRSIAVDLEATNAGSFDLSVSYLVRNVTWSPIYDARTSFNQNKVELISFGLVKQSTGEAWDDVKLFLSTAKPSVGGKMPELSAWYLKPVQYFGEEKSVAKAARAPSSYAGMQYEPYYLESNFSADAAKEKPEAAMVYASAEERGTAIVYEVKRNATIKADGTEQKVPISSQNLEADFQYTATPKLSPYAYLMAKVRNSKDGQLLPGIVNIFFEGDYIGNSSIPKSIGAEENFDLYLGIDEGITVKRKKLEEKVDETFLGGIPSRTKSISYSYKLIVENYKTKAVKFNLFDQIPVSEDDRIAVKKVQYDLEPAKKDYLDRKGVVRWDFELAPKQTKEVTISYIVEFPRDLNIGL